MTAYQKHETELSSLNTQLTNIKNESSQRLQLLDERKQAMKHIKDEYTGVLADYNHIFDKVQAKQQVNLSVFIISSCWLTRSESGFDKRVPNSASASQPSVGEKTL